MQHDQKLSAAAALEFQLALLRSPNLAQDSSRRTPSLEGFLRLLARDYPAASEAAKEYFDALSPSAIAQSTSSGPMEDWECCGSRQLANKSVVEAVDELLLAKRADGLSRRHIETLRSHLRRFGRVFIGPIRHVKAGEIEHWLRGLPIQARARNNIRASIVTLFRFAQKHNYLPRGVATEADEVGKAKDRGGAIGILSPNQLRHVLTHSRQELRLFLALGAFTGMRSSELLRLEWSEVNLIRGHIVVAAEKAKTATRRLVPILPNLREWLKHYSHATGRLFTSRRTADRAIAIAKASQIVWPNNALRHSYATYRLAVTADAARVALEMGNSPQKLITNYRELADPEEAQRWFSIIPTDCSLAVA
ncbi:MAG TPA: site-specific integrase [Chthoniobacterales bacterium]|nr:site-specific integrase [Chthoniobacterales bacterium]